MDQDLVAETCTAFGKDPAQCRLHFSGWRKVGRVLRRCDPITAQDWDSGAYFEHTSEGGLEIDVLAIDNVVYGEDCGPDTL